MDKLAVALGAAAAIGSVPLAESVSYGMSTPLTLPVCRHPDTGCAESSFVRIATAIGLVRRPAILRCPLSLQWLEGEDCRKFPNTR
jgi:hypothetical protein